MSLITITITLLVEDSDVFYHWFKRPAAQTMLFCSDIFEHYLSTHTRVRCPFTITLVFSSAVFKLCHCSMYLLCFVLLCLFVHFTVYRWYTWSSFRKNSWFSLIRYYKVSYSSERERDSHSGVRGPSIDCLSENSIHCVSQQHCRDNYIIISWYSIWFTFKLFKFIEHSS